MPRTLILVTVFCKIKMEPPIMTIRLVALATAYDSGVTSARTVKANTLCSMLKSPSQNKSNKVCPICPLCNCKKIIFYKLDNGESITQNRSEIYGEVKLMTIAL